MTGEWRPVQGPDDARPGGLAGTGHTLGTLYACHYWGSTYRPILAHADGSVTVQWESGPDDGQIRRHRTQLHPDGHRHVMRDDHPVTERCTYRAECCRRAGVPTASV